ncbi:hypothetical protein CBM2626_A60335 [Cupriavidus taiwanensis]|nr:hypothetical protein [Cupriavidus taiwanensis]SPA00509.1 hypothetical protein CBM2626_A60335 [Cupriavidus taiwanensis]
MPAIRKRRVYFTDTKGREVLAYFERGAAQLLADAKASGPDEFE